MASECDKIFRVQIVCRHTGKVIGHMCSKCKKEKYDEHE